MANLDHPNDEGRWTRLEHCDSAVLWKRERQSFPPLTQFYVVAPPRQHQILYDEVAARRLFDISARRDAGAANADAALQLQTPG